LPATNNFLRIYYDYHVFNALSLVGLKPYTTIAELRT